MNIQEIDKELELWGLKIKLIMSLKYYLINTSNTELTCFYRVLDLLKQKYGDANDLNFIEQGIRCNIQNYSNTIINAINNISSYIHNCNNNALLKDILNSITTGINHKFRQEQLERLIIEHKNITLEQNNFLERIEEKTNNI
jgi:hypothetical protein